MDRSACHRWNVPHSAHPQANFRPVPAHLTFLLNLQEPFRTLPPNHPTTHQPPTHGSMPKPFQFGHWLDQYYLGAVSEHWLDILISAVASQAAVHVSHYVISPLLFRRFYYKLSPRKQLDW